MKVRHFFYGLAAYLLSGLWWIPVYVRAENHHELTPDLPFIPFWSWLFSEAGLGYLFVSVSVFASGYLVSRLGSTRIIRVAGLVAMPLATLALFLFSPMHWVGQHWGLSLGGVMCLIYYPAFAAVICWRVARATHARRTSLRKPAEG